MITSSCFPAVHATTAQFPGFSVWSALEHIEQGVSEPFWGILSSENVQICPQTMGIIDEDACEKLRVLYPHIQFRLHANARVWPRHVLWDASQVTDETLPYFHALFDRQKRLGAQCMSIHAGYRTYCSEKDLWSRIDTLRCIASSYGTEVCIEGLYPSVKTPQWVDTWSGYAAFLQRDVPFALDLSHLNIVARKEGWNEDLMRGLVSSPLCREIHVSDNDGHRDSHKKVEKAPFWSEILHVAHPGALIFSEGRIL